LDRQVPKLLQGSGHANSVQGLSREEMHSNANLFMIAGTETTATLLSGVTYHLLQNPAVLSAVVTEIRGTFASSEEINMQGLQQLKYLSACLQEGLRIYPPVPRGLPRKTPPQGAEILGEKIPGNVSGNPFLLKSSRAFQSSTPVSV
jgi:cytochrome P450